MWSPIICHYVLQECQKSLGYVLEIHLVSQHTSTKVVEMAVDSLCSRNIFIAGTQHSQHIIRSFTMGCLLPASASYRKRWMCARAQRRTPGPGYWLVKELVGEGSWQDMSDWLSCKAVSDFSACWLPGETPFHSVDQTLTRNCMEKCGNIKKKKMKEQFCERRCPYSERHGSR